MKNKTHDLMSIIVSKTKEQDESLKIKIDTDFRYKLISFMEFNNWFNTSPELIYDEQKQPSILFDDVEYPIIDKAITQWITIYSLDAVSQSEALLQFLCEKYPKTTFLLNKYYSEIEINTSHKIVITEYLLYRLETEITDYTNEMLDVFVDNLCRTLTISMGMTICDLLEWCGKNCVVHYTNKYKLNQRSNGRINTSAYDGETFLRTIYYLFNPEFINKNRTYEKIAESPISADCFLYLSLHFICALRDSDLLRLPHPLLEGSPSDVLDSIYKGTFSDNEAKNVVNSITFQLKNLPFTPSKTSGHSDIPDIKFFVPESCKVIIGTYFAASEAHAQIKQYEKSRPLIRIVTNPFDLGDAMGEEFFQLFLEENFSSRRANKAYLQAIELFADDTDTGILSPKGYILAALARSHKGSYGEFAEITEIYLKDANLSGLTPEFVARELFERGVCSFIPSMLLKMIEQDDYSQLPITKQTLMIQQLDMSPGEIENLVSLLGDTRNEAINTVTKIIDSNRENLRANILKILHNIGCGSAASKQDDCLCILTAMHCECSDSERKHCIGCKHEISTKSIIYHLTSEYKRLKNQILTTKDTRMKNKYKNIITTVILPAMEEILECIKENYGDESILELESIIRRYT